jgi:hypothetical protein
MKFTAASRGAASFRSGAGTCTRHSRRSSCVWRALAALDGSVALAVKGGRGEA